MIAESNGDSEESENKRNRNLRKCVNEFVRNEKGRRSDF